MWQIPVSPPLLRVLPSVPPRQLLAIESQLSHRTMGARYSTFISADDYQLHEDYIRPLVDPLRHARGRSVGLSLFLDRRLTRG